MHFLEGYRRLSVVVGVLTGPTILIVVGYRGGLGPPSNLIGAFWVVVTLSGGTWLALWLAGEACVWVVQGFRDGPPPGPPPP